jgi:uncharacterized protein (TIGR01777 family)
MSKKIIMTGATGLIGRNLAKALKARGYEIIVFTRDADKGRSRLPSAQNYVEWDYHKPEKWKGYLEDAYAVIHLAGANLAGKRFTDSYKKKVRDSRIISTRNIVNAIAATNRKPEVFLCASGINVYGDSADKVLTEDSAPGNDFLAELCKEWEEEASKVEKSGTRWVSIRTSPVLSTQDAVLKKLLPLFKLYVGASLGSGKQWFSWIHIDDIVNTYIHSIENEAVNGPVNASAPNPVIMDEFAEQLGDVLHRPVFFRVPKLVMKAMIGESADFITASLRVLPEKLEKSGFQFSFPLLKNALSDAITNKK